MDWTPEQQDAINYRDGSLLVSAAAGSGKTAVLVERIVTRIAKDKDPVNVDELLVMTFTRAAAAEMKLRLQKRLSEIIKESPSPRLIQQQMLLPTADVSNMDSFCAKLVRENAVKLGIPVDFKVADEMQADLLKAEAVEATLEAAYEKGGEDFLLLFDTVNKKGDTALASCILRLYAFLNVLPDPNEFMREQLRMFDSGALLPSTPFGRYVISGIRDSLSVLQSMLGRLEAMADPDVVIDPSKPPQHVVLRRHLDNLLSKVNASAPSLDEITAALPIEKLPSHAKKFFCAQYGDTPKNLAEKYRELRGKIEAHYAAFSETALREELRRLKPLVSALLSLYKDFNETYSRCKLDAGMLDYADLERYMLRLLAEHDENGVPIKDENGQYIKTDFANTLSASYKEIYVDEYQDTNDLQNLMYCLLSQDEQNLFFVGDAKQSIYGFRHTSPKSFMERRKAYIDSGGTSRSIFLNHNFRSRKSVTEAVNFLFDLLMQKDTGGINYRADEQLNYGSGDFYSEDPDGIFTTELLLIQNAAASDTSKASADSAGGEEDVEAELSKNEIEARLIAQKIHTLMETATVAVKDDVPRKPRYSDFCILLRAPKGRGVHYAQALASCGIPVVSKKADGDLFSATEVRWVLSLLRFIDNPLLDVPLLSVLMSPLYGFTPDDMAAIKMGGDSYRSLYTKLREAAKAETPLGERCRLFLKQTDAWRVLAATVPADRLLWDVYETTDVLSLCSIRPNGALRVRNLNLLLDYTRDFEQNGFRGLSAFLRYFNRLEENGSKVALASAAGEADAVTIDSIHGSKGLEFPFVFVANIDKNFDIKEKNGTVIVHPEAGIGMKWMDDDLGAMHDSVTRRGVADAIDRDAHAEELRLLYVATTRAREKLMLVGTTNSVKTLVGKAANMLDGASELSAGSIMRASSYLEWIVAALLHHPDADVLRGELPGAAPAVVENAPHVKIEIRSADSLQGACSAEEPDLPAVDEAQIEALKERFSFVYPHGALASIPGKLAASAVTHAARNRIYAASAVPAFARGGDLTAAEKGTATHAFMQHADWEEAASDAAAERERLVKAGKLTRAQADAVDLSCVAAFFSDPLYARIQKADNAWRELPFTYALSVSDYKKLVKLETEFSDEDAAETLPVQGIADCVFEEAGELVILDYKTDRGKTMEELRDYYAPQLKLYAKALADTLGKPVKSCLIYSFFNGESIETGVEI